MIEALREALILHADGKAVLPQQDCYDLIEALDLLDRIRAVIRTQERALTHAGGFWR
jgi:hypothetical protein